MNASDFAGKPGHNARLPVAGAVDHPCDELVEMAEDKGVMAALIEAAKKKGVRLDIADFQNGDVECRNQNLFIFRGAACQLLDSIFKRGEGSLSTDPVFEQGHASHGKQRGPAVNAALDAGDPLKFRPPPAAQCTEKEPAV